MQLNQGPSIPLPRRLGTRTPRHTPLIPASLPQPLLRAQLQLPIQLRARLLAMYEIAEAGPHAAFAAVQPAARFPEVGHGAQLAVDGARGVPARVERVARLLGGVFVFEARVNIPDEICGGRKACVSNLCFCIANATPSKKNAERGENIRSLLLSQTTTSSGSPYLHISHQKSS